MIRRFRHTIAIALMPFLLVYAHGVTVAWLIYLHEWEDIVTHYCQQFSTEQCDGKAYVNSILDAADYKHKSAPRPPLNVQEMRAVLTALPPQPPTPNMGLRGMVYRPAAPNRGYFRDVFRPPSVAAYGNILPDIFFALG